ncbi:hypothetical protein [Glaciimonas sp. PCH181]|uniref:D-apionate lactonase n=1 Tax=Glaciimonas sp. PCH181 TaxID=2133943 RepID=UPI00191C193B|nr:hypothetical protein [Glaciimonas sp. PCH181]
MTTASIDPALSLLYYGTTASPSQAQQLSAGLLTVDFIDGGLRNICYAGHEVLRAIAYVVRDKDWGTYAPIISNLQLSQNAEQFSLSYDATCRDPDGQKLQYTIRIVGHQSGTLQFEANATAITDFLTCRNGFCVLHPIAGLAGAPVTITHTDDSIETSVFPALIAPWQPFKDIQAITHQVAAGLQATCQFEGDVFEMEDQRNWSDASYKTYVRPLARPWPYVIPEGETGAQSVWLQIESNVGQPCTPLPAAQKTVVTLRKTSTVLPKIGIAVTPEECASSLQNIEFLHAISPHIILCHFDPLVGHGTQALAGFAALAEHYRADYILECVLPGVSDPGIELAAIAAQIAASGFKPDGIAICPSIDRQSVPPGSVWPPCPTFQQIYRAARLTFPDRRLGGGMFSYFTELNRKRPPCAELDWVTHNTNPIVHAADDVSVMQTLETLPHITRSCRAMIGADKPYWVGPVTIGMRQNPYGSRTMPNPDGQRIPMASSDPRQQGLFGAAWLLGYAAQVADAGLEVLTLGALMGPLGLLGHNHDQEPASDHDHSSDNTLRRYPAFHIVAGLAKLAEATLIACDTTQPDKILAIAGVDRLGQTTLWIANLTASRQTYRINGAIPARRPVVRILDEKNPSEMVVVATAAEAISNAENVVFQGELNPYACVNYSWSPTLAKH